MEAAVKRADVLHFTPTDYLSDYKTRRLDLEEHGAYMLLLWHMWNDSDCQCEFPMDALALASIWGVSPERAMQVCESLIAPGVSLVKVVPRKSGDVLQSKRLREQAAAFQTFRQQQSAKGVRSGAIRRANSTNHGSTTVQPLLNQTEPTVVPCLGSPVSRNPIDQNPCLTDRKRKGRGVSQSEVQDVTTYFKDKSGRDLNSEEASFVKRAVKQYGPDEVKVQIGYALEAGADSIPAYAMDGLKKGAAL
jgi:uncharacterized protein YdaU (DUF1376 family)